MKPATELTPPKKVLIIKPSSLGDVVSAVPVLRGLKRTFPQVHVTWMLSNTCMDILADDPDLDEIIPFERKKLGRMLYNPKSTVALFSLLRQLRKRKFDWVIDLQGLLRSGIFARATRAPLRAGFRDTREKLARLFYTRRIKTDAQHTVDRNIELGRQLGIDATGDDLKLHVSDRGQRFAEATMAKHNLQPGRFVICTPPTRWPTKLYPPRLWRKVIAELTKNTRVVLIGGPGDVTLCRTAAEGISNGVVDLAGQTDLQEMVGIIAASGAVVCSDSAASLIAPAVGVPVVAMLGPTRPERTGPYGENNVAVVADVPCQGCLKRSCSHITCMELIPPANVVDAAEQLLAARSS